MNEDQIAHEGFVAYHDGVPICDNPYDEDQMDEHHAWDEGWWEGYETEN